MPVPTQPELVITSREAGTPDVALRIIDEGDMASLWPVDPNAVPNMTPANREQFSGDPEGLFDELDQNDDVFLWGIHVGDQLAGIATLDKVSTRWQDLGIAIVRQEFQGQGVGPRVLLGLADCAFQRAGAHLLYADPLAKNIPVHRVLESTGFMRLVASAEGDSWHTLWVLPRSIKAAAEILPHPPSPGRIQDSRQTYRDARSTVRISYS